ncbi:MAG: cell division protein FtsZ, partial [Thermoplasmata archaeon]|nr:cell division protein FtsZ [Thermoplasmata archaeon]
ALVHMTGGPDLSLSAAEAVAQNLTYELDAHANVIWGARIMPEFEGRLRVMAIMTGIHSPQIIGAVTNKDANKATFTPQGGPAAPKGLDLPWVG